MNDKSTAVIRPGEEPERLKRYIDLLCADLNRVYRHKIVDADRWQHERWDAAVVLLCKELGYADAEDFLTAYGYSVMAVPGVKLLDSRTYEAYAQPGSVPDPGEPAPEQPLAPPAAAEAEAPAEAPAVEPVTQRASETVTEAAAERVTGPDGAQDEEAAEPAVSAESTAPQKPDLLQKAGAWWKKFHNRLMVSAPVAGRQKFHSPIAADESAVEEQSPSDENPETAVSAEETGVHENSAAAPAEAIHTEAPESMAEPAPEGEAPADEADPAAGGGSVPAFGEDPDSPEQAAADEAAYPTIPLDAPATAAAEAAQYEGKHTRLTPTGDPDTDMKALVEEFRNAEASPEPAGPTRVHRTTYTPKTAEKKEREYTAKELFEATFGGIDLPVDDDPADEVERVFGEKEPTDTTPQWMKNIAAKMKGKEKLFGAIFAGILIMALLAVGMRIVLDKHEEKVAAAQAAAEAEAERVTYVGTGSFNVSITLPAAYTENPDLTQKEYNTLAGELGYDKMLLQADGSIIYIMSRERQYQMRSDVLTEVEAFFESVPDSGEYPEVTGLEPDSDYTYVKVQLSGDVEPSHMAKLNTELAYYCSKYQHVNGVGTPALTIVTYSKAGERVNTYTPTCP